MHIPAIRLCAFISTFFSIAYTLTAHAQWERLPGTKPCAVNSFAFLPAEGNGTPLLFAGTRSSGMYRSNDLGASWVPGDTLFLHSDWTRVVAIGNDLFALCGNSVFRSTDRGSNGFWRSTDRGAKWTRLFAGAAVNSFASSNGERGATPFWILGTDKGIRISKDMGRHWTASYDGLMGHDDSGVPEPLCIYDVRIRRSASAAGELLLYAMPYGRLFSSTDTGRTWSDVQNGSRAVEFHDVFFPSDTGELIVAATRMGIERSIDGGRHWIRTAAHRANSLALTIENGAQVLHAGTDSVGMLTSTDGGASWFCRSADLDRNNIWAIAACPGNSAMLFAGGEHGCHRSTDGGKHWTPINNGLTAGGGDGHNVPHAFPNEAVGPAGTEAARVRFGRRLMRVFSYNAPWNTNAYLFAGVHGSGTYRSTNAGTTWVRLDSGLTAQKPSNPCNTPILPRGFPRIHSLVAPSWAEGVLYIGTDQGVFRSTDAGNSWRATNNGLRTSTVDALAAGADSGGYLIAGIDGIFLSSNGGESWIAIRDGIPRTSVHALVVSEEKGRKPMIFAATEAGVFFSSNAGRAWRFLEGGLPRIPVYSLALSSTATEGSEDAYLIADANEKGTWRFALKYLSSR